MQDAVSHPVFPEITLPHLRHPDLLILFSEGLDLAEARLRALLELEREALLADALALLAHAQSAVAQYQARDAQSPISVAELSFPAHALWMLAHLRAAVHWPEVQQFLASEAAEFWLATALPMGLWQVIFHLGRRRLPALAELGQTAPSSLVRREVVRAVGQIGWHEPLRRGEVMTWMAQEMDAVLAQTDADSRSKEWMALIAIEVSQLRFPDLLPRLEQLYAQDRVAMHIAGQYADIVREVEGLVNSHAKAESQNMLRFYAHARRTWKVYRDVPGVNEQADSSAILDLRPATSRTGKVRKPITSIDPRKKTVRKAPKIGRNAPCPCGSGKKYKRCHGK